PDYIVALAVVVLLCPDRIAFGGAFHFFRFPVGMAVPCVFYIVYRVSGLVKPVPCNERLSPRRNFILQGFVDIVPRVFRFKQVFLLFGKIWFHFFTLALLIFSGTAFLIVPQNPN